MQQGQDIVAGVVRPFDDRQVLRAAILEQAATLEQNGRLPWWAARTQTATRTVRDEAVIALSLAEIAEIVGVVLAPHTGSGRTGYWARRHRLP
ncbi:hypothetical protein SNARM312S_08235 [Streptomyces narbonensis]